jgi:hypothetical protein
MADEQTRLAATISATTGVSIDAIKDHGLLGGEASMFRKNLGIKWQERRLVCTQSPI